MSARESPAEIVERLRREREKPPAATQGCQVVITGSRRRIPNEEEMAAFWRLLATLEPVAVLHHGAATGVDTYVATQVERLRPDIQVVPHRANWYPAGRPSSAGPDRSAGPIRNRQMLVLGSALIAFPGGTGTANCCRQAREMGRGLLSVKAEVDRNRLALERELIDPGLWT